MMIMKFGRCLGGLPRVPECGSLYAMLDPMSKKEATVLRYMIDGGWKTALECGMFLYSRKEEHYIGVNW